MLFFSLVIPAMASRVTTDEHSVNISNGPAVESFSLNTKTYRTEYRTESIERTCYRQIIIGYQTICNRFLVSSSEIMDRDHDHGHDGDHRGPERRPMPYPYPYPLPRPPVCYQQPIYQTIPYSCWQTVSLPYEVFDHDSVANLNVNISSAPTSKPPTQNCGINFFLNGDSLNATNTCSDYIALLHQSVEDHGNVKNYTTSIKILDAETVLAPMNGKLEDMQVNGNEQVLFLAIQMFKFDCL